MPLRRARTAAADVYRDSGQRTGLHPNRQHGRHTRRQPVHHPEDVALHAAERTPASAAALLNKMSAQWQVERHPPTDDHRERQLAAPLEQAPSFR